MKFRSFLLSTIILGSLVVTNATVLAEEIGSSTSETTEVNQMNEVQTTETSASVLTQTTEAVSTTDTITDTSATNEMATNETATSETPTNENPETAEEITNQLTDGQTITHTHQADLSEFTNGVMARSARVANTSQQAFIDSIASSAQSLANENDLYASVMIAQAIVESGWGKAHCPQLQTITYLESKEITKGNLSRCQLLNM